MKPSVEMKNIRLQFGGIKAVDNVSVNFYPGEVHGLLGHNGAGKSCLVKILSGAYRRTAGEILINGEETEIHAPKDSRDYGIETIYQNLALADNINAPGNLFLGREIKTRFGFLDDLAMLCGTQEVISELNPNFKVFNEPVKNLSGGQRQSVAIGRAVYFNAKILIMDEPTAALGPAETNMVKELLKRLKQKGITIILIDHDIHDVFELTDRVSVMKNGRLVGTAMTSDLTKDDALGMIIAGKLPENFRKAS